MIITSKVESYKVYKVIKQKNIINQMENCLFCKIIKKEIDSSIIYEDDKFIAILDISPINIGHSLLIPKEHSVNIFDIKEETLSEAAPILKKLSLAIKKAVDADGINIHMNNEEAGGQAIMHTHFHVIPRYKDDGIVQWKSVRGYSGEDEEQEIIIKIKSALK
ncbi:MAG: HIT family protein [Candidatus Paceibacterota bacterium]|jgi:histidine triad (HIT) family protein